MCKQTYCQAQYSITTSNLLPRHLLPFLRASPRSTTGRYPLNSSRSLFLISCVTVLPRTGYSSLWAFLSSKEFFDAASTTSAIGWMSRSFFPLPSTILMRFLVSSLKLVGAKVSAALRSLLLEREGSTAAYFRFLIVLLGSSSFSCSTSDI